MSIDIAGVSLSDICGGYYVLPPLSLPLSGGDVSRFLQIFELLWEIKLLFIVPVYSSYISFDSEW